MHESKKYPRKFDSSNLDANQKKRLADFFERRKKFDQFIRDNKLKLFTCPSCGYPSLPEHAGHDICKLCGWQDDGQDDPRADDILGGPNYAFSLTESRLRIGAALEKAGITSEEYTKFSLIDVIQRLSVQKRNWHKKKSRIKPSSNW